MDARLYELLGGYVGYRKTPLKIIQRQRLRVIAEINYQAEQEAEARRKQEETEQKMERERARMQR